MAAWLAVAALVGVLIGRVIRGRDRHVIGEPPASSATPVPVEEPRFADGSIGSTQAPGPPGSSTPR